MHISNKCSIAIHCLIFIHEYEHETKVTSELPDATPSRSGIFSAR